MSFAVRDLPDGFTICGKCKKQAPDRFEYCPFCGHRYLNDRIYRKWPNDCSRTTFSLVFGTTLLSEKGEIIDQKKILEKSSFEFDYKGKVEKMRPPDFESIMVLPKQPKCEVKVRTFIQNKFVDERILVLNIPEEADNLYVELLPISFSYKTSLFSKGIGISFKVGKTEGCISYFKHHPEIRF